MLASSHRITRPDDFRVAMRARRAASSSLVVHLGSSDATLPRVGFVVSKAVGTAVTRNLVKRRLRHLVRERLSVLPSDALLVVRALPAAAGASYADLGRDLDAALGRVVAAPVKSSGATA